MKMHEGSSLCSALWCMCSRSRSGCSTSSECLAFSAFLSPPAAPAASPSLAPEPEESASPATAGSEASGSPLSASCTAAAAAAITAATECSEPSSKACVVNCLMTRASSSSGRVISLLASLCAGTFATAAATESATLGVILSPPLEATELALLMARSVATAASITWIAARTRLQSSGLGGALVLVAEAAVVSSLPMPSAPGVI
mmetsp:Transcript_53191/g.156699  ORF Transcript_53191/g.156699 Transcript_53191/m.156699 type:complete len:203 (-) Transcript_53191:795-1403(-)